MKVYINEYYGVCATTPEQAAEEVMKKRYKEEYRGQIIGVLPLGENFGNCWKVAYTNCWGDIKGATLKEYEVKGA